MSTSTKPDVVPEPVGVRVTDDVLSVDLADGRTIIVPLNWFPRLFHGTPAERAHYELSYAGIHWPDLDEDVPVEGLLRGQKSGESLRSLQRWLDYRARGERMPVPTYPLPPNLQRELDEIRARERKPGAT